ncbi:MAG: AI-2E family transporter [Oscillospiraceae bacterium]|nr:AI-2E family transporter [Oscillospiraceae bacterium]MBR2890156.1 AI-2E family transporter [Oscillospiraceae bacterium]
MSIQKKRDFLVNFAYYSIVGAGVFLALKYLLPITVPFIIGVIISVLVVRLSNLIRLPNRIVRILLTILVYGVMGLVVGLLAVKGVSALGGLIQWLPQVYEHKLMPFVSFCYDWFYDLMEELDPAVITVLQSVKESALSALKNVIASLSGVAVSIISGLARGIPSVIFSVLAMIFSTIFIVCDYEGILSFASRNIPGKYKDVLKKIRVYMTDTLFVVIRSYVLIMLMTFTELSLLFMVFGIENAMIKAAVIAVFDIMPILGTGGIMIPWAVISLVLGYTKLGIELFVIYGIVTVVRNYMEPKIVGAQLSLHPIISLVSMFIGLRVFGFWGLFGAPVAISFFWKQRMERIQASAES